MISWPCVRIPMSSKIGFRKAPKAGARTATTLIILRNLFRINVVKASFSTSAAIIRSGRLVRATCSKIGIKSCFTSVIFLSVIST